ncbi:holin [Bacillus phage vB_BceM-HSE3]|nr:holin [Bacillus phage vB_BceM-HSE3]
MDQHFTDILLQLLMLVSSAVISIVGVYARKYVLTKKVKAQLETKQVLSGLAVQFVEEAFKELKGEQKLNEAVIWVTNQLNAHGIPFTESEVEGLVQANLKQLRDEVWKDEK